VAVLWGLGALAFVAARLPVGVLPRPPRLLVVALALSMVLAAVSGGDPVVEVGGIGVGLGGLLVQTRFVAISLGLLWGGLLLGWTTPAADLPGAAAWMLAPMRRLRIPVDDVVAALSLAVRSLPLVADELTTMVALWRVRPRPQGRRSAVVALLDLSATATTSAVRRATELGAAVEARGPVSVVSVRSTWGRADAWVAGVAAVGVVLVVFGP
jgi:energy-coupling factor transport system permease protein